MAEPLARRLLGNLRTRLARGAAARQPSPALWAAVLAVAALALASVHVGRPASFGAGDSYIYADIGRRIASGRGFTTGSLYPAELSFGVSAEHPSLKRAPLWPLVLAAFFRVLEPGPVAARVALICLFLGCVAAATALAARLAGGVAGAAAGIAVATSPWLLAFTLDALSELLLALLLTLVLLLCVQGRRPLVLGAACGLAYLARPNGLVALPTAMLLLALRERALRPLLVCVGGFALVASPWWIRNFAITGNPFFSLYSWLPWYVVEDRLPFRTLIHVLEPSRDSPLAVHPLEKIARLLPRLLERWPPASMNLAACLGVALGCVRRDAPSLALAFLAAGMTGAAALGGLLGRYFVPLLPVLLAIGAAAWWTWGGRLRWAGLALLVAAPLLPALPPPLADMRLIDALLHSRPGPVDASAETALTRCLEAQPLVMSGQAGRIAWLSDAIALHPAATRREFWRIVERYPVRFVQVWPHFPVPPAEFERAYAPRPDCAPGLYERIPGRAPPAAEEDPP